MMIWLQDLIMVIGETINEEGLAFGFWIDPKKFKKLKVLLVSHIGILTFEKVNLKLCF